jgi:DNA polymerase-3 subunit beta
MNNFVKALKKAVSIIPRNVSYPILGAVLLQGDGKSLNIIATNDEISIKITVDCSFKLDCCTNGKLLCDFLQSAKDVKLEQGEQSLKIYSDNSELKLPIFSSQDFPIVSAFDNEPTGDKISVFASDLKDAFKKVDFVPIRDWYDPFKASVLLHYQDGLLRVVASDDHRLAVASIIPNAEEPIKHKKVLLSKTTITGLENILPEQGEIGIQFSDNGLFFTYQNIEEEAIVFTRPVDKEFPNYEKIIPHSDTEYCEVLREDLVQSLNRASLVTDITNISAGDNLEISGFSEKGKFKETVPLLKSCSEVNILCNLKYLLQPLNKIEDETIKLLFKKDNPLTIRSKQYVYILSLVEKEEK